MKSLGEILSSSERFLQEKGVLRPRFVAQSLLASVLGMKRMDLYLSFDRPLQEEELAQIRPLLKRASLSEPIEYILKAVSFAGLDLEVDRSVLIPRPETELLVHAVGKEEGEGKEIWDLCTGSGCIGLSLKKRFQTARVVLSDLSQEALTLARKNGERNNLDVEYKQGDLLAPFEGQKGDIVVCNPPYVTCKEYDLLDPSVRCFEPSLALVGGEDGLVFYRRLAEELPSYLHDKAKIFLEIGRGQGSAVSSLFSAPCWQRKRVERDWSGLERFFFLEFERFVV